MQLAVAPVPDKEHVPVNPPVPLLENETDPVGVLGVAELSVTVAVQLVELLTTIVVGWHVTTVVVGWSALTANGKDPLLIAWDASPP